MVSLSLSIQMAKFSSNRCSFLWIFRLLFSKRFPHPPCNCQSSRRPHLKTWKSATGKTQKPPIIDDAEFIRSVTVGPGQTLSYHEECLASALVENINHNTNLIYLSIYVYYICMYKLVIFGEVLIGLRNVSFFSIWGNFFMVSLQVSSFCKYMVGYSLYCEQFSFLYLCPKFVPYYVALH